MKGVGVWWCVEACRALPAWGRMMMGEAGAPNKSTAGSNARTPCRCCSSWWWCCGGQGWPVRGDGEG